MVCVPTGKSSEYGVDWLAPSRVKIMGLLPEPDMRTRSVW